MTPLDAFDGVDFEDRMATASFDVATEAHIVVDGDAARAARPRRA